MIPAEQSLCWEPKVGSGRQVLRTPQLHPSAEPIIGCKSSRMLDPCSVCAAWTLGGWDDCCCCPRRRRRACCLLLRLLLRRLLAAVVAVAALAIVDCFLETFCGIGFAGVLRWLRRATPSRARTSRRRRRWMRRAKREPPNLSAMRRATRSIPTFHHGWRARRGIWMRQPSHRLSIKGCARACKPVPLRPSGGSGTAEAQLSALPPQSSGRELVRIAAP